MRDNINLDAGHPLREALAATSRWNTQGAGRADVSVSGGDIGGTGTLVECWGVSRETSYWALNLDGAQGDFRLAFGNIATDCVFQ